MLFSKHSGKSQDFTDNWIWKTDWIIMIWDHPIRCVSSSSSMLSILTYFTPSLTSSASHLGISDLKPLWLGSSPHPNQNSSKYSHFLLQVIQSAAHRWGFGEGYSNRTLLYNILAELQRGLIACPWPLILPKERLPALTENRTKRTGYSHRNSTYSVDSNMAAIMWYN